MDSIFEIIDSTNDEMFFPLGVFNTFEEAKEKITNYQKDESIGEDPYDEYEKIEIVEREFGWSGHGKKVFTLERKMVYDEKDDEYYWVNVA